MFRKIIFFSLLIFVLFLSNIVFATEEGGIVVKPYVIDEKAHAKDILEYDLVLKNNNDYKVDLYAVVNDILPEEGNRDFDYTADKSTSLSKWINIKRGAIEIFPGEEKHIPLKIKVNLSAKPGQYHSAIIFSSGHNRTQAEENAKKINQTKVLINIEIEDETIEKAQINYFKAQKNIFLKSPISFSLELRNLGNVNLSPHGDIYIYNRQGKEVGNLKINQDSVASLAPGESYIFKPSWPVSRLSGKFKARLNIFYGPNNEFTLQDVVYFYYLPWQRVIIFVGLILFTVIALTVFLFKKTYHHHHQNLPQANNNGVLDLRKRED